MNVQTAVGIGFLVSMRTMTVPALVSSRLAEQRDNAPEMVLFSQLLKGLAFGENVMDKLPFAPNRNARSPLLGRMAIAGLVCAMLAEQDERIPMAMVGAASAFVGTELTFFARKQLDKRLHIPDPIMGLLEDRLVVAAGNALIEDQAVA